MGAYFVAYDLDRWELPIGVFEDRSEMTSKLKGVRYRSHTFYENGKIKTEKLLPLVQSVLDTQKRLGLSRPELAERMGMNYNTVSRWTRGLTEPTEENKERIRDWLRSEGVDVEGLE